MQQNIPPWYKQFWPWLLIALPGTVVIASIVTIVIATRHPDSLVVDDYYKKGLAINRELAADKEAARLHLRATATISGSPATLDMVLTGDIAEPPEQIQLQLIHPSFAAKDIRLQLTRGSDGHYRANWPVSSFTTPTRWKLILQNAPQQWQLIQIVTLPTATSFDFSAIANSHHGEAP